MGDSSENSKRVKLSDGRFLAYRESGVPKEEAKYKIILVHGFGSSKDMNFSASKELIQELGVYLLFYDRSGYGESDSNAKRSLKSEVDDIVELADQLSGVAFVAPVVNYWWPSLPKNLIKENYMGGLIRWGLRISKLAPGLLHWLVIFTQKVLPSTSSVLESKQVYFSSHDMEVLKRTTGFPMFTKDKLRRRDVFDTLRDDFVACFGQWDFEPADLSITQESNVHIWHGKEDKVVPFQLQRCVLQKQPLINYHEIPQGGHLIVHYDGTCDAILHARRAGLIFHKRMEIFLEV
uniref:AB hydrolase-1 domain-containing protein n=1 Tax=Brassica campestris TaxID=3711 RepID=M4EPK0_BRACM